ncbi:MAG: 5-methyltetrahydropteroyltriglutamate--homocysteine S-methyltransferase [Gammaproteobacteria bacterium]|nr:5-methyltetrahydropteroyltriglutamate--homocysteine S-methyltransferase [Gammaproteobacteria bacterium]
MPDTDLARTSPPFRADMVGSLLRSTPLKTAREQFANGKLTAAELTGIEDQEIRQIVRKQEEIGLKAVTDGEFRRSQWHFDFYWALTGIDKVQRAIQFKGIETGADNVRVTGRLAFDGHPMLEHFRFLARTTSRVAKMTIPSPSVLHFRTGRDEISTDAYPDLDQFFADLALAYHDAIQAFYAAGCRYLQLDDTIFAHLCDAEQCDKLRAAGTDPDTLAATYVATINAALADRPADLRVTTHTCRGNYRSSWFSQGGYEPIAELLFNEANVDGFFLEYDTDRAGGFEPLRFLPRNKLAVLGLITTKTGELEDKDAVRRRIDEATHYADLEQLCLSPQCGFASTEEGNLLTEADQWRKLALIVDIADEVWGSA